MNIRQLTVVYLPEQDRLLVRLNTHGQEELRLWLTRRLVLRLWPALQQQAQAQASRQAGLASPQALHDPAAQSALADFQKADSLSRTDFNTPFDAGARHLPLGDAPVLVTEVSLTPTRDGAIRLGFQEKLDAHTPPRSFELTLSPQLLHGWMHLLEQALEQSQWIAPPAEASVAPAGDTSAPPRHLH